MDLQGFGVSIYLIQVIFGAVDLPAKLVGFLVTNSLGRRPAQVASLFLAGICILVNGVVPQGEHSQACWSFPHGLIPRHDPTSPKGGGPVPPSPHCHDPADNPPFSLDQSIVRTSLAVLGKGCLAASFNCIFLYTGEVYPTMIR